MLRRFRARTKGAAQIPFSRRRPSVALPTIEFLEQRQLFSTYTVTTTANSGAGSFRDAITKANGHAGADVVAFKIGTGAKTIPPTSALPTVTGPTVLDATTHPGFAGKPLIELNGTSAGSTANGLKIN